MRKYILIVKNLALTSTAKDTYILFAGNLISAFLGFVYTLVAARILSLSDFGIFSAAMNLVYIIIAISDLGISNGTIQFVSKLRSDGKHSEADKYVKSAFVIKLLSAFLFSCVLIVFPHNIAQRFLATGEISIVRWIAIATLSFVFYNYFPYVIQAEKKFLKSVIVENSFGVLRLLLTFGIVILGISDLPGLFLAFTLGNLGPLLLGFLFIGTAFLSSMPGFKIYKNLILFSGWLGVNRVISSVSGRLDLQMLAGMAGALETGIYSIPARLTIFIAIITSSFSSVLATRLTSFNDKSKERSYIIKASFALIPVVAGIILWIIVAEPFIIFLFGSKYASSVQVFRVLAASSIPFLLTAPATSAIVFSMKKPVYIGLYALPQLILIYILNRIFIPQYKAFGPAYTMVIVNILLCFYLWFLVIKYYWFEKKR